LPLAFEDLGGQQVKNIAQAIRVYRVQGEKPPAQPVTSPPLPDKSSIAVLSFANMSNDPEQEFFADGIAEDVITALSRYPSLFVIARNSCFTYKGRAVDVKQVGRELGVRYVLEGSLRKSGNRIRVTAQLVEAETGNHVWAERYDRDLANIFAVQDEITEAVTIAIAPAIAEAERQRAMRRPPESLDAWAAYQRGLWHLSKVTVEDFTIALKLFETGTHLDPGFAGCYSGLALGRLQASAVYQLVDPVEAQSSAELFARRAVALDGANADALSCLGWALQARGELAGALAEIEQALAMSPNLAVAHWHRGAVLIFLGRPKEGLASIDTSIRLDPRNPFSVIRLLHITCGLYFSGEYGRCGWKTDPLISGFPDGLSLVCGRTRPTRSQHRSKGCPGQGHESRACRIQHVRAQSCTVVSAGRSRSPARWAAQSRLGGVTATHRLAAAAQNLSSGGRRGDRVSCRKWGGMRATARRQGRVGDGRR
jgi:adenylate cyclase